MKEVFEEPALKTNTSLLIKSQNENSLIIEKSLAPD